MEFTCLYKDIHTVNFRQLMIGPEMDIQCYMSSSFLCSMI
jgi:hypothetical protein